jgi:cytochrome c oxidase assembly protein subunit 15
VSESLIGKISIPYASPRPGISAPAYAGGGPFHWLAILTACATFPLIFMGGLVTSHQAGMSVPDWPNSYGYNMFLFPPRLWIGGILYEHTHRLMASLVGILSIALVVAAFLTRGVSRRERGLAIAVLGAVIFQGVLGGLRVVLVKLDLAIVHACVAQAFFCLAALMALLTSLWWKVATPNSQQNDRGGRLVLLGIATVGTIYLQLIAGATMRHFQAGLAIPDLPLAYGKLLPPIDSQQLDVANFIRTRQLNLDPVTLGQIWLHMGHRLGAILVTMMVLALATLVIRRYRTQPRLVRPAVLLLILLATQLTLGVLTVVLRKPADVASAHVAIGALVLVTSFVLTARAWRIYAIRGPVKIQTPGTLAGITSPHSLAVA